MGIELSSNEYSKPLIAKDLAGIKWYKTVLELRKTMRKSYKTMLQPRKTVLESYKTMLKPRKTV